MTPEQLRVRAFKNIETAKAIVDNDPDYASYTVGYALEYVLKARFCSKLGLTEFPDDRSEAKKLQIDHAFTHNLDVLLSLTGEESISRARTANVDWSVASDWGVERRYTPVGNCTVEQALAQIEATERVCGTLCQYEVIDLLQKVELEASQSRGPFNVFAFAFSKQYGWEVVVAFWALDEAEREDRMTYIDDLLNKHLDLQLQEFIGALRFVEPEAPELHAFYVVVSKFLGPFQHAIRAGVSKITVEGAPSPPPAWLITCVNWSPETVIDAVRKLPPATAV